MTKRDRIKELASCRLPEPNGDILIPMGRVLDIIDEKAHWIDEYKDNDGCVYCYCSNCDSVDWYIKDKPHYCRMCGCRMED